MLGFGRRYKFLTQIGKKLRLVLSSSFFTQHKVVCSIAIIALVFIIDHLSSTYVLITCSLIYEFYNKVMCIVTEP